MKKLFSVLAFALLLTIIGNPVFAVNLEVLPTVLPNTISNYTSFQSAFSAIEQGGHGPNPIITVKDNFTQVIPAVLSNDIPQHISSIKIYTDGPWTVTFTPTIASFIIRFDGISNAVIDGRINRIIGVNQDLTFVHNNTNNSPAAGIWNFEEGCTNNVMQYVKCTSTSLEGRMIRVAPPTTGVGNDNNSIKNCIIDGGSRGIQTFGSISTPNSNTVITGNNVKNASTVGILIGTYVNGAICENNVVYTDRPLQSGYVLYRGIHVQGAGTISIQNNNVFNLRNTSGNYSYIGIHTLPQEDPNSASTIINLINNNIALMDPNLNSSSIYGMLLEAGSNERLSIHNIFHNTCRIGGAGAGLLNADNFALGIYVSKSGSTVNSYNNIAQNERTATNAASNLGYDLTFYPANITLNSDYNNGYSVSTINSGDVGYNAIKYKTDLGLAEYKDSTCSVAIEQHTSIEQSFFSGITAIFLPGTVGGNMCGKTPLSPPVLYDILGTTKDTEHPYKGCYESLPLKILSLTACLEEKVEIGETCVEILNECTGVCSGFADINAGTSKAEFCFGDKVKDNIDYTLRVRTLNHLETFSLVDAVSFNPHATYSFPPAYGDNLTTLGCFFGGDVYVDSIMTVKDLIFVYNDAKLVRMGCRLRTDINSDGIVDVADLLTTHKNVKDIVQTISPCPQLTAITETVAIPKSQIINKKILNNKKAIDEISYK